MLARFEQWRPIDGTATEAIRRRHPSPLRRSIAAAYDDVVEYKALTYTSMARPGIRAADVDAIIASARINNPLDGLTGVLIFNGTSFMQILEGGEAAVDDLVRRLTNDPRHSNISIRDQRSIATRAFPDWSMAYLRLENGTFEGEDAVSRALERDLPPSLRNVLRGMTHAFVRAGSLL